MRSTTFVIVSLCLLCGSENRAEGQETDATGAPIRFRYAPSPPDNPLKGLVPYAGNHVDRFGHSMEFNYLPLSGLMIDADRFDWQPLETLLDEISGRRHQAVFRIWMEYPGHRDGIPAFLERQGLKVTEWKNTNTDPFPAQMVRTPDYSDPRLIQTLERFIVAMGKQYDGDARIGFITAGLLGTWGEWHTYPRVELMANKDVQSRVMNAYESAFKITPILLRYPAGDDAYWHAANHQRRLGYHDDSFAWATLDTGREEDDWFFMPAMKAAGAMAKWKASPIGGEIRPELWGQIFDPQPRHDQAQDFAQCVEQTHVTWLMDTGMFEKKQSAGRIRNAANHVSRMGYEFHVRRARIAIVGKQVSVNVEIENRGVAPFYYDWKVELGAYNQHGECLKTWPTNWSVMNLLPKDSEVADDPQAHQVTGRKWVTSIDRERIPYGTIELAVRVVNPLSGGMPLVFANHKSNQRGDGWLRVGTISLAVQD